MKDVEGIDVTITQESIVCDACYEKHYRICQKGDQTEPDVSLSEIVVALETTVAVFKSADKLTEPQYIQGIASLTALELVHTLLIDEAILLLDLYEVFKQFATKYVCKVKDCTLPGVRWLHVYLCNVLTNTLGSTVKHRRYGTLLYNNNGDILNALSKALGDLKSARKSEYDVRKQLSESMHQAQPPESTVSTDTIINVSKYLNKIIISNAKKLAKYYNDNPHLLFGFHIC